MPLAIQMTKYGSPSVLNAVDVPRPKLASGELLIEVIASAVNRADCEIRSGKWQINHPNPFPYIPGLETIGKVVEVGDGVVDIEKGALIITMMQKMAGIHGVRPGGYQEYVKVPVATVALVPKSIDPIKLAGLGLAGVTAITAIAKLNLVPGDRALIHGGTGGVGAIAIQLAKQSGAYVIATTQSSAKNEMLKDMGADEIWDLSKDEIRNYCKDPVDAVFEMVGGEIFGQSVSVLRKGGHLCSIGALTGGYAELSVWNLLQDLHITGWSSENLDQPTLQKTIDRLCSLLERGLIKPPKITKYPLTDAAKAHSDMESGKIGGRLLLVPKKD